MPTLIELSPEESERLGVSHVVEEPYAIDGNEPEFISTNGPWQENEWFQAKRGLGLVGAIDVRSAKSNGWRFARRATPAEIAAQAPSVGRDELVDDVTALVRRVSKELPEDWAIHLVMQKDWFTIRMADPQGEIVDLKFGGNEKFGQTVTEMVVARIEYARAALAAAGKGE